MAAMYTIGQLARRVGMPTSTLRYYEKLGLVTPTRRTDAGYRLYDSNVEQTLMFIQRAQRIGFSLSDIDQFLAGTREGRLIDKKVAEIAEERYLEIERQLTDLKILQHELELFLYDFRKRMKDDTDTTASNLFSQLIERVCGEHTHQTPVESKLGWLLQKTGCNLAEFERDSLIKALNGQHVHVWRSGDAYSILVPGHDSDVIQALEKIAAIEADCHAHPTPQLVEQKEGFIFKAKGKRAFLFAEFFLALELSSQL